MRKNSLIAITVFHKLCKDYPDLADRHAKNPQLAAQAWDCLTDLCPLAMSYETISVSTMKVVLTMDQLDQHTLATLINLEEKIGSRLGARQPVEINERLAQMGYEKGAR